MNGKPPGKEDTETDHPSLPGTEEDTASNPVAPTPETEVEQEDAALEAADEAASSPEQTASESLAEQVQNLDINEVAAHDASLLAEDGEEAETYDDDGDGEWISSFALH